MIYVLINWIFIAITSYPIGFFIFKLLMRGVLPAELKPQAVLSETDTALRSDKKAYYENMLSMLLGLAAATAYAQIWSLFSGVGLGAVIGFILLALGTLYINRQEISGNITRLFRSVSNIKRLIGTIPVLLFAYGTSRGYMHFDTNLYHAQAIRWIEEYGIVYGLANLQSRFGYNSAEFALNALFSFKWLLGQSLHTTAGFIALLSSLIMVDIKSIKGKKLIKDRKPIKDGRLYISDFIRMGLLFYLGLIFSEMISPASDYYAQLLIFDIIILWLDIVCEVEKNTAFDMQKKKEYKAAYQGVLCLILVFGITIKLSIGLLALLALIPGLYWIGQKNIKAILTCLGAGLAISLPYFIRNYIISGWILYPSTIFRLGSPDWQIPIGEAQYDAKEIGMWGRGITDPDLWREVTAFNWIKNWFAAQGSMDKLLLVAAAISAVIIIFLILYRLIKNKKDTDRTENLYILAILLIGTVFWFVSAPLVRYGYVYLLMLPAFTVGFILTEYMEKAAISIRGAKIHIANIIFIILLLGTVIFRGKSLVADIIRTADYDYYIKQQDYIDGNAFNYEIEGVKIYVADDSGQIGYYKFPSSPGVREDIELRGEDLSKGFRKKQE